MNRKILFCLLLIGISFASDYTKKEKDIVKLLDISGATELEVQALVEGIDLYKEMFPEIPEKIWIDFLSEIDNQDIIDIYLPLYDKYFTHQDIKELIQFYDSPIGKKMIRVEPYIMQESMIEGEKWGEKISTKLLQNIAKYME